METKLNPTPDSICARCHEQVSLEPDLDPSTFCNTCAQNIVEELLLIVPKPPNAIDWEKGVEILNVLQKELYAP